MLETGQIAPGFEAALDDGTSFRLADYRGKKNVVLYFYPADFTGGCTREACAFRDNYGAIEEFDAIIVGASADSTDSHRRFKEMHDLGFPLISDPDGEIARSFEVNSRIPGIRPRITYVIDKRGIVRSAFRHDIAVTRHIDDVIEALKAIEGSPVT